MKIPTPNWEEMPDWLFVAYWLAFDKKCYWPRKTRIRGVLLSTLQRGVELTEKQLEYIRSLVEEHVKGHVEREVSHAFAPPAPEGRVTVRGTVLGTKWKDSDWGAQLKMLVQSEEGWKCYGSVPTQADSEEIKDRKVQFVATLERSKDDECFAFYKRPSKFEYVDAGPPPDWRSIRDDGGFCNGLCRTPLCGGGCADGAAMSRTEYMDNGFDVSIWR